MMKINTIIDIELEERIEKLIEDYNSNNINGDINYYVDDWGELLDTVKYLLEKLKRNGENKNGKPI